MTRSERASLRTAFATPELRRCQLVAATARLVDIASLVAVSVHLFGRGGATAVALFGVIRTLVPALGTPFITAGAGGRRPGRTLAACLVAAAAAAAGTAVLLASDGSVLAILVLAGLAGVALAALRPLVTALLPGCIRGPAALVATNAAAAMVDNLSTVLGPLLAGAALATIGGAWVLWGATTLLLVTGAAALGLDGLASGGRETEQPTPWLGGLVEGLRTLGATGPVRLVVGLTTAQTFVRGAVNVLVVSLVVERLAVGDAGVGLLLGAIGLGGVVGLPIAVRIAARDRMARVLGVALVLWGAPLVVVGLTSSTLLATGLFAVVGIGNALVDISCDTLLQRLVPAGALARVLGAFEAVIYGGMALGAVAAERLLSTVGVAAGFQVVGLVLPTLGVTSYLWLRAVDRQLGDRDADVALLQLDGILSPLMLSAVDHLARCAERHTFRPGEVIVTEGDPGHHYFVVEEGHVEVRIGDEAVAVLGPGEGFGEMSLLDDAPRSATVAARTVVSTRSLRRADFLMAMAGSTDAHTAARRLVVRRRG